MKWSWQGAAAFILALCLGLLVLVVPLVALLRDVDLSASAATGVSHTASMLAGGVVTWLGMKLGRREGPGDE